MLQGAPSRTAVINAVQRGLHRLDDDQPWIVDDPFALVLVGPQWREVADRIRRAPAGSGPHRGRGYLVARARVTEDRLRETAFAQYVILGAGLDAYAWRHPDALRRGLRVFEVDHPATGAWKQSRIAELGLPSHDNHSFVPTDFSTERLADTLNAAGFDPAKPTLFSWLGVAMYLTIDAVEEVLRFVAACAPGSEIVWTYWPVPDELDEADVAFREELAARQADEGEPIVSMLSASLAEDITSRCNLDLVSHPHARDLARAYFVARTDRLAPASGERIVVARTLF